jgi:hypothetical protein
MGPWSFINQIYESDISLGKELPPLIFELVLVFYHQYSRILKKWKIKILIQNLVDKSANPADKSAVAAGSRGMAPTMNSAIFCQIFTMFYKIGKYKLSLLLL